MCKAGLLLVGDAIPAQYSKDKVTEWNNGLSSDEVNVRINVLKELYALTPIEALGRLNLLRGVAAAVKIDNVSKVV